MAWQHRKDWTHPELRDPDRMPSPKRESVEPSAAVRSHADPCIALMGKDDERVEQLRKTWAPGWAR